MGNGGEKNHKIFANGKTAWGFQHIVADDAGNRDTVLPRNGENGIARSCCVNDHGNTS